MVRILVFISITRLAFLLIHIEVVVQHTKAAKGVHNLAKDSLK